MNHKTDISGVLSSLRQAGLKVTKPRIAILQALIRSHGPFSMDEIHQAVKEGGVDRVTVYRCVEVFHHHGIVRRCDFGEGPVKFEYQGIGAEHHHHVICRVCRRVESLSNCLVQKIESSLSRAGYCNITHSLEFFATCSKCSSRGTKTIRKAH